MRTFLRETVNCFLQSWHSLMSLSSTHTASLDISETSFMSDTFCWDLWGCVWCEAVSVCVVWGVWGHTGWAVGPFQPSLSLVLTPSPVELQTSPASQHDSACDSHMRVTWPSTQWTSPSAESWTASSHWSVLPLCSSHAGAPSVEERWESNIHSYRIFLIRSWSQIEAWSWSQDLISKSRSM